MSNPEVVMILHRNILKDLPSRLRTYSARLDSMPKLKADVAKAASVIDTWLKGDATRMRCVKPYASWEWLAETCKAMGAWAAAMVIETKLQQWREAREESENARELKAARMMVEESEKDG